MLFIIFVIFFNRFLYRSLIAVDEEGHREDTVKFANELFDKLDTDRSNDISIDELFRKYCKHPVLVIIDVRPE